MEMGKRRSGSFLTGLLIGGALGGVAGLLFAPKSGSELRADIKTTGQRAVEGTKGFIGEVNRQASEKRERARNLWSCVKRETSPQYKAESAEESVREG